MQHTVGIFGGAFDPPHKGHAGIIIKALERCDTVIVVPAARHPFGKIGASFDNRFRMCGLMIDDIIKLLFPRYNCILRSEIERVMASQIFGPICTVDVIKQFAALIPTASLRLILSTESYAYRDEWKDFAEIERIAPPIILDRDGFDAKGIKISDDGISSTKIREALKLGYFDYARDALTKDVFRYIRDQGLYDVKPDDYGTAVGKDAGFHG